MILARENRSGWNASLLPELRGHVPTLCLLLAEQKVVTRSEFLRWRRTRPECVFRTVSRGEQVAKQEVIMRIIRDRLLSRAEVEGAK